MISIPQSRTPKTASVFFFFLISGFTEPFHVLGIDGVR